MNNTNNSSVTGIRYVLTKYYVILYSHIIHHVIFSAKLVYTDWKQEHTQSCDCTQQILFQVVQVVKFLILSLSLIM